MKGRRGIVLAVSGSLALGVAGFFAFVYNPEPSYQGKRLSEWCAENQPLGSPEAADAIRHIGAKAVPWLVDCVAYEPPAWESWIVGKLHPSKLSRAVQEELRDRCRRASVAAMGGFRALGTQARAATPDLVRLLTQTNDTMLVAWRARVGLDSIGKAAVPQLLSSLDSGNSYERRMIISLYALTRFDFDDPVQAARILGKCAADPDTQVAIAAVRALAVAGWIRSPHGDVALSQVIKVLGDPRAAVRLEATRALLLFAPEAKAVLPALRKSLGDPDGRVRDSAHELICIIDPENADYP